MRIFRNLNVSFFRPLFILAPILLILTFGPVTHCQLDEKRVEIGIDEKLGDLIPMDAVFTDEDGQKKTLKEFVDGTPFILSLVFYRCPSICSPLLTDLGKVVDHIAMRPGQDFKVMTISFDATESHPLAKSKKANYFAALKRNIPEESWRFLSGDAENIKKITEAVGFRYKKAETGWIHSGAIMAISPEGKISRYLLGITFLPFDVKMALAEASQGKTGPTINKFLLYCYNYDPQGRTYVFNILAVVGTVTLFVALTFLTFLFLTTKKYRTKIEGKKND